MAAIAACALGAGLLAATPAVAGKRKIQVRPGKNAIQNAIDRARSGQVLRIHPGRYPGSVFVDKRVKLVGVGKGRPVIDGRCEVRYAVEVAANRVRLKHLKVVGADEGLGYGSSEVDFRGVSGGKANDLVLRDTCDAEYGVNVFDTGPIKIRNSRALGFDDAGFYIGEIGSTGNGAIRLQRSEAYRNLRGVIVENSAGGDIRVTRNDFHDNDANAENFPPTGVLIDNSDGVLVASNEVADNLRFGLRMTADSDFNVINDNLFFDNPVDIADEGAGNCGSGNVFETGDLLPPC